LPPWFGWPGGWVSSSTSTSRRQPCACPLRELRFHLDRAAVRITYWIAPGRRIVLLTVFVKSVMREIREIERARRALARCIEAEHDVDEDEDHG